MTLLALLIYEELSFFTAGSNFHFIQEFNIQNEINIHNLSFWKILIFKNIPFFESISIMPIIIAFLLLLFGFGSFLPISKSIKILFLEKELSFFSQIYIINIFITRILEMPFDKFIITPELVELFLYLILFLDTKYKLNKANKIYCEIKKK